MCSGPARAPPASVRRNRRGAVASRMKRMCATNPTAPSRAGGIGAHRRGVQELAPARARRAHKCAARRCHHRTACRRRRGFHHRAAGSRGFRCSRQRRRRVAQERATPAARSPHRQPFLEAVGTAARRESSSSLLVSSRSSPRGARRGARRCAPRTGGIERHVVDSTIELTRNDREPGWLAERVQTETRACTPIRYPICTLLGLQ